MSQHVAKKRRIDRGSSTGPHITDSRFTNIQSDPRYRLPGKKQKIRVDERFAKALQDEDFSRNAKVDRYGRALETDAERKRLRRKYDFEGEEKSESESDEADDDDEVQAELNRVTETRDLLREGREISSSEDDTSSDEESEDEEEIDVNVDETGPGVQDRDVPMGEISSRMAVVNLDWDNIRAEDLMAVFQSFLPATGRLLKVAVYPSEFGKERIEREEMEGPPKEIFATKENADPSDSDLEEEDEEIKNSLIKPDDGSEFDSTALRQYQLDRLRYYYAVLTFSDSQTAKTIYEAVDGTEYLSTANFFDLRFVPDDTDFSSDIPREECERIPAGYRPNEFVTDALQHSKVKLTWDTDDTTRKEAQARAFRNGRKDIDDNDLQAYLGSDSDSGLEEVEGEQNDEVELKQSKREAERQKMRALLGFAPEPEKKSDKTKKQVPLGNIQITFSSGLSRLANDSDGSHDEDGSARRLKKKHSVFQNSPEPEETTVEKYVRKEKERKQRRKDKMKANLDNPATGAASATDGDPDQADASGNKESDLGFDDPFFAEPAHDAKSTHKQRKAERLQRRAEREAEEAASAKQRAELEKLMADDNEPSTAKGRTVKHFDMNEIEKAEKAASSKTKKKKHQKHKKDDKDQLAAVAAADAFKVDTTDPRFARLYENHEFAIDPSNPRYRGTKAMKALLDEGRKRKEKLHTEPRVEKKKGGRR